jgi:uncharacterized delta-60 repeat protein
MTISRLSRHVLDSVSASRRVRPQLFAACLGVGLALATGCGGDDDTAPPASSGTGGKGATGGKGGSAGKSGSAGTGAGGTSAGKGGAGGKGGSGGDSGSSGKGGSSSGGGSTGGSSTGGTGIDAGAGGEVATGGTGVIGMGGESASGGEGGVVEQGGTGGEGPSGPQAVQRVFALSPTGPDRFFGVNYAPDGSIYAVGQIGISTDANADLALLLAKFTPAGELDAGFGSGGVVVRNVTNGTNGELYRGIVVQSTGKVVVAGATEHVGATDARDRDIAVLRFNADGTKDTTFGTDGVVTINLSAGAVNGSSFLADSAWGLERYADDRLVVSGGMVKVRDDSTVDTDFVLVRLSADGAPDLGFGDAGVFSVDTQFAGAHDNASPRNLTILPGTDGIIGAGYRPVPGADTAPVLYKVTDAGVLDTTFGTNGVWSEALLAEQTECYQAVVQPKIDGGYDLVTTGYGRELESETTDFVSLRVTSSGVLDTTYGTNGLARVDIGGFGDNSRRLTVLPDRRLLLVGGGRLTSADVDGVAMVLTEDGQPDTSFAPRGFRTFNLGGPADFLWSAAISPDKKTVAIAGIEGVGTAPTPPAANDDTALVLLPVPQ